MADREFRVVVAGAGVSGLFMAETLKRAGIAIASPSSRARSSDTIGTRDVITALPCRSLEVLQGALPLCNIRLSGLRREV